MKKLVLIIILWSATLGAVAQNAEREANLKAAFIYSFTKYIDWGGYNNNYVFVIGVIGNNSAAIPPLEEIAKTRTINNKRIVVRIIKDLSDVRNCDIVFITSECPFPLHKVLDQVGKGVLTISESNGYASLGTDFNFIIVDQKLKFEANLRAIGSSGLKAGSQLLKLAIIVDQG